MKLVIDRFEEQSAVVEIQGADPCPLVSVPRAILQPEAMILRSLLMVLTTRKSLLLY